MEYQDIREIFSLKVMNWNLPWLHRIKRVMTIPSNTGTRNILLPKFMFAATSSLTWGTTGWEAKRSVEKTRSWILSEPRSAGNGPHIWARSQRTFRQMRKGRSIFFPGRKRQRWGFGMKVYKEACFSEVKKKKTFNLSDGQYESADLHRTLTCPYRNQVRLRGSHRL